MTWQTVPLLLPLPLMTVHSALSVDSRAFRTSLPILTLDFLSHPPAHLDAATLPIGEEGLQVNHQGGGA